jgi:mannose-6-phosphate isomerase-like protein (cupin superfamily)
MRARLLTLALTLVTVALVAQMPAQQTAKQAKQPPANKTYVSAADVTAMMGRAKNERKQDQANFSQALLQLAPYSANMEYRSAVPQAAAVHEKEAELFYVIDGSGTLVTGGKLVGETRNGDNLTGTAIDGGDTQAVAKGDFFIVPENTPHWFSKINGTLVLMSLHVPRPR